MRELKYVNEIVMEDGTTSTFFTLGKTYTAYCRTHNDKEVEVYIIDDRGIDHYLYEKGLPEYDGFDFTEYFEKIGDWYGE